MSNSERTAPLGVSELWDMARYCGRAVVRHRRLGLTVAAVAFGLTLFWVLTMANKYSVTVRILTKRSYLIPSLVNPQRAVPLDSDRPTRGAIETIQSYGFREELLDAATLPELLERRQRRLQRLQSSIETAIFGKVDPRKIRAGLIEILGRSIEGSVIEDRVLNIVVSWTDPEVAHILAEELVQLFLRKQKAAELDEIYDTVDIIRRNVVRTHSRLTETTTRLGELVKRKEVELTNRLTLRESRERRTASFRRPLAAPPMEAAERGDRQALVQRIREMERELRHLTDGHEQRLLRAQQNLARLEKTLGPQHPDLQSARREVEQARPRPQELVNLEGELAALRASEPAPDAGPGGGARFDVVQMPLSEDVYNALQADPEVSQMMEEARKYASEYGAQLDRLEAADLEIEMSNAAFAYRFTVTQPPILPTKPVASTRKLVLVAGLAFSLLLALAACVLRDLASGRVRARWQVERLLGARILGRVDLQD